MTHRPYAMTLHTVGMPMSHLVVLDGLDGAEQGIMHSPARGTRSLMRWTKFARIWEGFWRAILACGR